MSLVKIIKDARFIKSAPSIAEAPDLGAAPEFVLVGRSNVGKSSFINCMLNRKNLAKTSNTPGKTRLINYYLINEKWVFVDLPGYGYAKVSKSEQEQWRKNLEQYLLERKEICRIIQLVDARHGATELDIQMHEWLVFNNKPVSIILTKADKVKQQALQQNLKQTSDALMVASSEIIVFSAEKGTGKHQVQGLLEGLLNPVSA